MNEEKCPRCKQEMVKCREQIIHKDFCEGFEFEATVEILKDKTYMACGGCSTCIEGEELE